MTSDGTFRYNYDDEGNRVAKTSLADGSKTVYHWDHRNRLVQVVASKETVAYTYDYMNRMTRRNDEFIVHDGWQIVASLKNNKIVHRYLWGANQDELLAVDDNFTLCDHLGSVRDVVNADGKVFNHIEYNAFGKVTKQTGKSLPVFGYTGKLFDNQTKLQWNINRWYDAEVGRWISEDPIGFLSGDTNCYRYVGNIILTFFDPNGLEWVFAEIDVDAITENGTKNHDAWNVKTFTGDPGWFTEDASYMWGGWHITPSKNGGTAWVYNSYHHYDSGWIYTPLVQYETGAEFTVSLSCDQQTGKISHTKIGPNADPSFDAGINFSAITASVIVDENIAQISIDIQAGVSASKTVTTTSGIEISASIGGEYCGVKSQAGLKYSYGRSVAVTGPIGVTKGGGLSWQVKCICK